MAAAAHRQRRNIARHGKRAGAANIIGIEIVSSITWQQRRMQRVAGGSGMAKTSRKVAAWRQSGGKHDVASAGRRRQQNHHQRGSISVAACRNVA